MYILRRLKQWLTVRLSENAVKSDLVTFQTALNPPKPLLDCQLQTVED